MSTKKFSVGQIVYIFIKSESKLVPALITEEIIRRTVSGISSSYMVQVDKADAIEIGTIKSEIYGSSEEALKILTDRTVASIKKLVDNAVAVGNRLYPQAKPAVKDDLSAAMNDMPFNDDTEDGYQLVEMPDGSVGKIRIPNT